MTGLRRVSHPFYDFNRITRFSFPDGIIDDDAEDVYLEKWEVFESRENVKKAVKLCRPLLVCDNMYNLLQIYENMEPTEQAILLPGISDIPNHILRLLDEAKEVLQC